MNRVIYLDNAATTATDPDIAQAVAEDLVRTYANPSSPHRLGLEARNRLEQARASISERLGGYEVVFSGSGTEAIHLGVRGAFGRRARRTRRVLISSVEHPAVVRAAEATQDAGALLETIPVHSDGRVDLDRLDARLAEIGDELAVLAVMAVQNEIGTIMPLAEIARALRRHAPQAFFFVDAVQALGKVALDPAALTIDGLAFAAHKIHGPKGVGCLALRPGARVAPLLTGGGQEKGLRSGTPNVAGACGFATAFKRAVDRLPEHVAKLARLRETLVRGLLEAAPFARVNGPSEPEAVSPAILSISFPGLHGERIQHALEADGIYCSTASACHSASGKPSRVLTALGFSPERARSTVRFGLSWRTSLEDITTTIERAKVRFAELTRIEQRS